ncbi:MAG: type II toxin-antitoxin system VapB family antitoxin [Burkholderiales bacterium]|jgi:Arc/MetJ family transcription regulator|nr:type II toxin-antitoxin system VapB family antitoxin [Burkholderiales bacterium]
MHTAINFDDELLTQAQLLSHLTERIQLLRKALLALVQRESTCRLARLEGTEPHLQSLSLCRDASE